MDLAFKYVETSPLELSSDYPYKAADGTCSFNAAEGTGSITSYKDVPVKTQSNGKMSVHPMKAALALGPVSVGVAASSTAFQQYKTGILNKGCGTQVDHGILAVGWGTQTSTGHEYILVKNQWGTTWGENGFIMIDIHNVCEILANASYPIV
jgi:C1A family cysteine protease